jgi:hypothetical protein
MMGMIEGSPEEVSEFIQEMAESLNKTKLGKLHLNLNLNCNSIYDIFMWIGEYLSDKDDFNQCVCAHVINSYVFQSSTVEEALRKLLSTFKLPGEAQQIDRSVFFNIHDRMYRQKT